MNEELEPITLVMNVHVDENDDSLRVLMIKALFIICAIVILLAALLCGCFSSKRKIVRKNKKK